MASLGPARIRSCQAMTMNWTSARPVKTKRRLRLVPALVILPGGQLKLIYGIGQRPTPSQ